MNPLLGAIEAGGTEFVCAVAERPGIDLYARRIIPTTTSEETIRAAVEFLSGFPLKALGVACFGPIDIQKGRITTTPKPGWQGVEIVRALRDGLRVAVNFDTDVDGAALGEAFHGAGRAKDPLVYVTVGTGIGAGLLVGGRPVHGLLHPEAGHMSVARHPEDGFRGSCPFHADCLEGLASGPAIQGRWGSPGQALPADHPAWELEAFYLAEAMCNLIFIVSPQRIVLGGGVMNQPQLLDLIRAQVHQRLAGYLAPLGNLEAVEDLVVAAELGDDAGIVGALELAREAAGEI